MNKIYEISPLVFVCALLLICCSILPSCKSTQNAVYFSDLDSAKLKELMTSKFVEPLIQVDDVLGVTVQTLGQAVSTSLNQTSTSTSVDMNPGTTALTGFLVDREGNIEIPMIGILKLEGLTTTQAKEIIRQRASKYYKDPTVQVRFSNYKITVLGEVSRPATYTVPNEKVSILDVISMAGDLTIYGKRENVLLIRDNGNKKELVRLNLNSSSIIASPYFYLKQNDVLYIEPNKAKVAANNAPRTQLITIGIAITSLIVTIISRL